MLKPTIRNLSVNGKSSSSGRDVVGGGIRIGYARVSTLEQDLRLQLSALAGAGCVKTFEDRGVSGTSRSRPGLGAALAMLSAGDVLVVWRLDRLGRSLSHLVQVIEELDRRGIGVASLTESIDSKSSGGRLILHVMAALAEFERALIAERTRAGLAAAKSVGQRLGRPPRLSAGQCAGAARVLEAGATVPDVARSLGVHPRTLIRALRRTTGGEPCNNQHEEVPAECPGGDHSAVASGNAGADDSRRT